MNAKAAAETKIATAVHPTLRVGAVNDPAEREADAVADMVTSMRAPHPLEGDRATPSTSQPAPVLRRSCNCAGGDEADALRRKPSIEDEETEVQMKAATDRPAGQSVEPSVSREIESNRGGGNQLPGGLRSYFEPRFGTDLSGVRLHDGFKAAGLASSLNSRAFTVGRDIFFGPGEFRPQTDSGRHLIAHEITHTLQGGSDSIGTVRREVRANRVSCANAAAGSRILTRINTNDPVGDLQAADARAIEMLDSVVGSLESSRQAIIDGAPVGWPTISDALGVSLRDRLGLDPTQPAVWTGEQARSVLTVSRRFRGARRHLVGGFLRYQCMGSPSASSHTGCAGPDCEGGDWASTCPPSNLIVLCQRFWDDGVNIRALTMLHEAMHIFFDVVGDAGQFANAGCYDQLVADFHGLGDQGVC